MYSVFKIYFIKVDFKMKKNICDVCWTLYRSNTTFDFIDYFYKDKPFNLKKYILDFFVIKFFILSLGKVVGKDIYRYLYISLLNGVSRKELLFFSKKFYSDFLITKKINFTFEMIETISQDSEIILCSASLDIIVYEISKRLNVKFIATQLVFEDDICTGKIESDLLGNKNNLFLNNEIDTVITDNLSDYKLVKLAKKSVILSTQKNVRFWESKGISVDYILED